MIWWLRSLIASRCSNYFNFYYSYDPCAECSHCNIGGSFLTHDTHCVVVFLIVAESFLTDVLQQRLFDCLVSDSSHWIHSPPFTKWGIKATVCNFTAWGGMRSVTPALLLIGVKCPPQHLSLTLRFQAWGWGNRLHRCWRCRCECDWFGIFFSV